MSAYDKRIAEALEELVKSKPWERPKTAQAIAMLAEQDRKDAWVESEAQRIYKQLHPEELGDFFDLQVKRNQCEGSGDWVPWTKYDENRFQDLFTHLRDARRPDPTTTEEASPEGTGEHAAEGHAADAWPYERAATNQGRGKVAAQYVPGEDPEVDRRVEETMRAGASSLDEEWPETAEDAIKIIQEGAEKNPPLVTKIPWGDGYATVIEEGMNNTDDFDSQGRGKDGTFRVSIPAGATIDDAEIRFPPVWESSDNPSPLPERFEATNLDLNVSLPGEQAFIALISLIETMFEGATPEQKEQLVAFHIQNVNAWNSFWKIGDQNPEVTS